MAKASLNVSISGGSPFTIPAGKYFVGSALPVGVVADPSLLATVVVGSSIIASVGNVVNGNPGWAFSTGPVGPLTFASGTTISASVGGFGMSGFLYDN